MLINMSVSGEQIINLAVVPSILRVLSVQKNYFQVGFFASFSHPVLGKTGKIFRGQRKDLGGLRGFLLVLIFISLCFVETSVYCAVLQKNEMPVSLLREAEP